VFRRTLLFAILGIALLAVTATFSSRLAGAGRFRDLATPLPFGPAGFTPSQIAAAYDFTPLYQRGIDGTGQKVALIEIDSFDRADLTLFDATYGLPAPHIKQYFIGTTHFRPAKNAETAMDIQWFHALAPGARIQIYYLNNHQSDRASWRSMATALRQAVAHGAGAISISLGTCPPGPEADVAQSALSAVEQAGVSVFVSSGDDGDHPGSISDCGAKLGVAYPGGDPSVVSVGGTSLQLNPDNSIASEIAWGKSGGGRASSLLRSAWEAAPPMPRDRYRWAPDVAFLADPDTGVRFLFNGAWMQAGGTSLGAPSWAAAWALIRQDARKAGKTLIAAPPLLYRVGNSPAGATAFHDITSGSNGAYQAHVGWDAVTGWGTPDVAALDQAVQSAPTTR